MKNYKRGLLLVTMLVIGIFIITGCGKKDLTEYEGTYEGKYTKLVGDEKQNTDEKFSLELKSDGTGKHNRNDMSFNVTWEVDGENFTMKETFVGDPIVYTGTLKDGKLDIFNGDPKDIWTYEYVYEKK